MKAFLLKACIRLFENRTFRKLFFIVLLCMFLLFTLGPVLTGASAVAGLANFVKSAAEFLSGSGEEIRAEDMTEDTWLLAFENGYEMGSTDAVSMKISEEDFIYLLERTRDYNRAGEKEREITIQGERKYKVRVPREGTRPDGSTYTYYIREDRIDYPEKTVTVSNRIYEGMDHLDYRLLYYGCVLATLERNVSGKALENVSAKDSELKSITSWEETENTAGYFIEREDIDKVFSFLTIDFRYYFDILRDGNDYYTFESCAALPHEEEKRGNPDTLSGQTTFYYPRSYLLSGEGGFSRIESSFTDNGSVLVSTQAVFCYDRLSEALKELYPSFRWEDAYEIFDLIPGGKSLLQRFTGWGQTGHIYKNASGFKIRISPGWSLSDTGSYPNGTLGLSDKENRSLSEVWEYLTGTMGFSKAVAAGICGNVMQESAFQPELGRSGSGAAGIFQWAEERKLRLLSFQNPWSVETQLDYFRKEFESDYLSAADSYSKKYFGSLFSDLTDPLMAAEAFCVTFEGCIYDPDRGYGIHSDPDLCTAASDGKRYQDLELRKKYTAIIYQCMAPGNSGKYQGTDLPYYPQSGVNAWSDMSLGIGTVLTRGCSLCAAAMAASYCTGRTITPADIVMIPEVYRWTSSHSQMSCDAYQIALRTLGVSYRVLDQSSDLSIIKEQITIALLKHHPVILSVRKGSCGFTNNTHYIVLRYMDSKGGVYLHDPNGAHVSYSLHAFSLDEILTQLNNRSGCAECIPEGRGEI